MSAFKKLIDSARNEAPQEIPQDNNANVSSKNEETTSTKKHPTGSRMNSTSISSKKITKKQEAPAIDTNTSISSKNHKEVGKRNNPNYRQTSIYVHKDLHRRLTRLLEDQGYKGDFSDWIEDCMTSEIIKHQEE